MTDRPLAAIVLAAGQGKRMRLPGPKVLAPSCGRALVEHVLEALRPLRPRETVIVHGHGGDAVREALRSGDYRFAHQAEQKGTGHAVQCALPALDEGAGDILVLCGDTPLLTTEVLQALLDNHRSSGRALTVLSAALASPGSLGRVLRGPGGTLERIIEARDATRDQLAIREINTGVIVADRGLLAEALTRVRPDNKQGEYYLTDVPALLLADGAGVDAYRTDDEGSALGVNTPVELAEATRLLRRRLREHHLRGGVRMEDAETTVVDAGAEIGEGTRLAPHTFLARDVRVGAACEIGPFCHLGPGAVLGAQVTLGARVEVRRSTVDPRVTVEGPARVVGASIGREAHLGPGVVCEGTGRIVVGERARIGAGSILRGPVTVAEGARVAAGTILGPSEGRPPREPASTQERGASHHDA